MSSIIICWRKDEGTIGRGQVLTGVVSKFILEEEHSKLLNLNGLRLKVRGLGVEIGRIKCWGSDGECVLIRAQSLNWRVKDRARKAGGVSVRL